LLERLVLATPVGEWSVIWLFLSLAWMLGMAGLSVAFAYDDLVLNQRSELVSAVVVRTNYDQRSPSYNAELSAPFQGLRVLVEDLHDRPATGERVTLEIDPRRPARVRDPERSHWRIVDGAFVVLLPAGLLIAWARASRGRRHASLA